MVRFVNATQAKNRFGAIIQEAYLKGQHLIIKRDDIPVVAIVPMSDYERLLHQDIVPEELSRSSIEEQARRKLLTLLDDVHSKAPTTSEKEADQDIRKAIKHVRSSK